MANKIGKVMTYYENIPPLNSHNDLSMSSYVIN